MADEDQDVQAALADYQDPSKDMLRRVGLVYDQQPMSFAPQDMRGGPGATRDPNDPALVGAAYTGPRAQESHQLSPQSTGFSYNPPQAPQFQDIPEPHLPDPKSSFEAFKSPLVLLGALGTLFTRRKVMNAMAFATGAMKGYNRGQKEEFDQQREKFREEAAAIVEHNRVLAENYKSALVNFNEKNWAEVAPGLYSKAASEGDQLGMMAIRQGPEKYFELAAQRERIAESFQKTFEQQEARDAAAQAQIERWTKDPGIQARVKEIRDLKAPAPPQSSRNPQNQAIWEMLSTPDPETGKVYDITDYTKRTGALQILSKPTSQNQGGRAIALNASTRHLEELDALIDALKLGNLKLANDVSIELRRSGGYPEITNYEIGADIASKEVVKAIVPGGGSAGERDSMEKSLAADHGPKALHAAANTLRGFLSKQYSALNDWATEMGVKPELDHMAGPAARLGETDTDPNSEFRRNAKAAGYSDPEIEAFLAKKKQ